LTSIFALNNGKGVNESAGLRRSLAQTKLCLAELGMMRVPTAVSFLLKTEPMSKARRKAGL
jgi:hypothetical protein